MYQIRGRIGRSSTQAHAYFYFDNLKGDAKFKARSNKGVPRIRFRIFALKQGFRDKGGRGYPRKKPVGDYKFRRLRLVFPDACSGSKKDPKSG